MEVQVFKTLAKSVRDAVLRQCTKQIKCSRNTQIEEPWKKFNLDFALLETTYCVRDVKGTIYHITSDDLLKFYNGKKEFEFVNISLFEEYDYQVLVK